jgi:hypothetical protein
MGWMTCEFLRLFQVVNEIILPRVKLASAGGYDSFERIE